MYERVWNGRVDGKDLAIDFSLESGLFRCGRMRDVAGSFQMTCAEPIDTEFMANASLGDMVGRFQPFSSTEEIVAGTWRSPADWPEERKSAAVRELPGRMRRISDGYLRRIGSARSDPSETVATFALMDCSKLLNAMYGGPGRWPREAFDSLFGEQSYIVRKGFDYYDPFLTGDPRAIPREAIEVVRDAASVPGRRPSYMVTAAELCAEARRLAGVDTGGASFRILTSVDSERFVDELARSNRITSDLVAKFDGLAIDPIYLGTSGIELDAEDADRLRLDIRSATKNARLFRLSGPRGADGPEVGFDDIGLTELASIIHAAANYSIFFRRDEIPDLGFDFDVEGDADRVLIACGMSEWYSEDAREWRTVSWSKSRKTYLLETIDAWGSGPDFDFEVKESTAFPAYPDEKVKQIIDGHRNLEQAKGLAPFLSARYAADRGSTLERSDVKAPEKRSAPGTGKLKRELENVDVKIKEKERGETISPRPGYFTY